MVTTPSTNFTLPVGGGSGYAGTITLVGSKDNVERMMNELNLYVRNTLQVQMLESAIPDNAKPSPCRGCGN